MAVIFYLEPKQRALDLAFEVVSAIGTVGLSLDLTDKIALLSKVLIIILMFLGRVGPYTLLLGIYRQKSQMQYRELTEDIQTY